jgi:anthranilate synthase component 1
MKAPFDITADLDTPVSAFLKLAAFRPHFLLESVEGGERLGRYSFIGFGEAMRVTLDADGFRVNGESRRRPEDRDTFLDALRDALSQAPLLGPNHNELPFAGGLVGVAGYDVVRLFERLPERNAAGSGLPEAAYIAPASLLVFDHLTRRAALLHSGSEVERRVLRNNVVAALRGPLPALAGGARFAPPGASMSQTEFERNVRRAQESIAAGDVYQLVLSINFSGTSELDPFETYRALRLLNPSPYMYFLDLGATQIVGSSPEALVKLEGRVASLRPIAGTRPRGADEDEDQAHQRSLLADPKENAEHVMLVDLARNDLGRVAAPGTIKVDPYRTVERYSHVMHIVSGVTGELEEGRDAFDLLAAAFPAGTLVGAPKVRAMELIEEWEPQRRGLYAGTVGYFAHGGSMDQAIAIRTLVFHDGGYSYQAGAGIVADSDPTREYEEVLAKARILGQAMTIAGEGL